MSNTEDRKLREFWIQKGTPDLIADSWNEAEGFSEGHRCELEIIHVREVSSEPEYKEFFRLKTEDWLAACREVDKWEKLARDLAESLSDALNGTRTPSTFEALYRYRNSVKE